MRPEKVEGFPWLRKLESVDADMVKKARDLAPPGRRHTPALIVDEDLVDLAGLSDETGTQNVIKVTGEAVILREPVKRD